MTKSRFKIPKKLIQLTDKQEAQILEIIKYRQEHQAFQKNKHNIAFKKFMGSKTKYKKNLKQFKKDCRKCNLFVEVHPGRGKGFFILDEANNVLYHNGTKYFKQSVEETQGISKKRKLDEIENSANQESEENYESPLKKVKKEIEVANDSNEDEFSLDIDLNAPLDDDMIEKLTQKIPVAPTPIVAAAPTPPPIVAPLPTTPPPPPPVPLPSAHINLSIFQIPSEEQIAALEEAILTKPMTAAEEEFMKGDKFTFGYKS